MAVSMDEYDKVLRDLYQPAVPRVLLIGPWPLSMPADRSPFPKIRLFGRHLWR